MHDAIALHQYLAEQRALVEDALRAALLSSGIRPSILHDAMRYSVLAGGKRLRPILTLMAAELCGKSAADVVFAAAALEMIHTYSLIHDDLPAMDNDDLRRGLPTTHKQYGEAVAILAGDALLTLAFEVMSDPRHWAVCAPETILRATHEVSCAAGAAGMVGGQVLDMQAEQRRIGPEALRTIHALKTGKLFTAALRIGAILAEASPDRLAALTTYGERIGLAFQIVDDILDLEGEAAELGKAPHSDLINQKSTYPSVLGLAESRALADRLAQEAQAAVRIFGRQAQYVCELATYIVTRTH
jgi:geranylgeranyl diphosphate synthase, type II